MLHHPHAEEARTRRPVRADPEEPQDHLVRRLRVAPDRHDPVGVAGDGQMHQRVGHHPQHPFDRAVEHRPDAQLARRVADQVGALGGIGEPAQVAVVEEHLVRDRAPAQVEDHHPRVRALAVPKRQLRAGRIDRHRLQLLGGKPLGPLPRQHFASAGRVDRSHEPFARDEHEAPLRPVERHGDRRLGAAAALGPHHDAPGRHVHQRDRLRIDGGQVTAGRAEHDLRDRRVRVAGDLDLARVRVRILGTAAQLHRPALEPHRQHVPAGEGQRLDGDVPLLEELARIGGGFQIDHVEPSPGGAERGHRPGRIDRQRRRRPRVQREPLDLVEQLRMQAAERRRHVRGGGRQREQRHQREEAHIGTILQGLTSAASA